VLCGFHYSFNVVDGYDHGMCNSNESIIVRTEYDHIRVYALVGTEASSDGYTCQYILRSFLKRPQIHH
jgi:hypothetical protein